MDRQTILLISDMRQVCLAEILTKKGHNVRCLDIRNRETALQQLEKLKRFLDKADVLIPSNSGAESAGAGDLL